MKLCLNHLMRRLCSAILGLMFGVCACVGSSASSPLPLASENSRKVYYVSPSGSDSNPGTHSRPFLTIQKCASRAPSCGTCYILAGTYHETVTPHSSVTFTPYKGASVTVTGADAVTGWTKHKGAIYKASVSLPGSDTSTTFANQVFVGNRMMWEAQWPDPNGQTLMGPNWEYAQSNSTETQIVDPNLPSINWKGAYIHVWGGTDVWQQETGTVTSSSTGQFNFTPAYDYCPYICGATGGGWYYLFGILGALTDENEWYYNSGSHVLYLWAPNGVDPNTLSVYAKQRLYCFDLSNASNVTIKNINLFACSINSSANSSNDVLNGVNAQYVSHITTIQGDFQWSESGIILNGTGNTLENSTIEYSSGNGVTVVGQASNITITNNLIYNVDYMAVLNGAVAVGSGGSTPAQNNITITYNTMYETGAGTLQMQTPGPSNVEIGYNDIYHSMSADVWDNGGIYIGCCGTATGTNSIDHNWIHDIANGGGDIGVYLDQGEAGWTVTQNIIWNIETLGILLNSGAYTGPNDNFIYNNTLPDTSNDSGNSIFLSGISNCGTTEIENNMVGLPVGYDTDACTESNNTSSAPGATQMNSSVAVGCNFNGCASPDTPPSY